MADDTVLTEQLDYYRARALEYDKWWMREGRFDRGPGANTRWFAETTELERVLERFDPRGDVLELACGTGLWTRHLVESADTVTAVDAAPPLAHPHARSDGEARQKNPVGSRISRDVRTLNARQPYGHKATRCKSVRNIPQKMSRPVRA
jgi:SAM-dependent methyltransferase